MTTAELIEALFKKFDVFVDKVDKKFDDFGDKIEAINLLLVEERSKVAQQGEKLAEIVIEVEGTPGNGEPGMRKQIDSLLQSRWYTRWGYKAAWSLLILLIGGGLGIVSMLFSG